MHKPFCLEMTVTAVEDAGGDLYSLQLSFPAAQRWEGWQPGQFVMLHVKDRGQELTWARPFSICRATEDGLILFIQAAGRGTRQIKTLQAGDVVDVWGPLGNAFAVEPDKPTLLLAGGIGLAPFVGYIESHPSPHNVTLEFGHRMPLEQYPFTACTRVRTRNHYECSREDLDCFIEVLDAGIADIAKQNGLVLACGPQPFLRTVQQCALKHNAKAQLSLETRMACGVGACLGCVVQAAVTGSEVSGAVSVSQARSWVQTCTCGPVFWADQVSLDV